MATAVRWIAFFSNGYNNVYYGKGDQEKSGASSFENCELAFPLSSPSVNRDIFLHFLHLLNDNEFLTS